MNGLNWEFYEHLARAAAKNGWGETSRDIAAQTAKLNPQDVSKLLPYRRNMVLGFSKALDCEMLAQAPKSIVNMRVHERIASLVMIRFQLLKPHKAAVQRAFVYLSGCAGIKLASRTVDAIWIGAGDTSTDINRYSKRVLLYMALAPTMMDWLTKNLTDEELEAVLMTRLKGAMNIGRRASNLIPQCATMTPKDAFTFVERLMKKGVLQNGDSKDKNRGETQGL